jgi:hypothetical protein
MNEKVVGLIRTGGVLLLFVIGILLIMNAMGTTAAVDPVTQEVIEDTDKVTGSVTFSLYLVYACLIAIGGFTVWSIIQNPKRFIVPAIGIVAFLVIGFIGYSMASTDPIDGILEHPDATEGALKWSGAGVKTTFILVIIAVALILVSSVMNMMKYFSK